MDHFRIVVVLVIAAIAATLLIMAGRSSEMGSESEDGQALEWITPDVDQIFAAKRSAEGAQRGSRVGIGVGAVAHFPSPERELARAESALDQAHARLAAKAVVVAQAEASLGRLQRNIIDHEIRGDNWTQDTEVEFEIPTPTSKDYARAALELEEARKAKEVEQAHLRSAEARLEAATNRFQVSSTSPSISMPDETQAPARD